MPDRLPHILNPRFLNGLHTDRVLQHMGMSKMFWESGQGSTLLAELPESLSCDREESLISREIPSVINERRSLVQQPIPMSNKRLHSMQRPLEPFDVEIPIPYIISSNFNYFARSEPMMKGHQEHQVIPLAPGPRRGQIPQKLAPI